jgi:gluconokinase
VDGDDLHPQSNVDKMKAGVPLTDQDRQPWLRRIRSVGEEHSAVSAGGSQIGVVIACSALKRSYRDILRGRDVTQNPFDKTSRQPSAVIPTYFVYMDGSRDVLFSRMQGRQDHFMKPSLLDSQLATLENPQGEKDVVVVSIEESREEQVRIAKEGLTTLMHADEER